MLLAINWADVGVQAAQLLTSLSILIILHEFGHFITARWFKCRVEKFYLFFDPWFSLFKKKVGETEYGIGWLPLGGYVKISGMIDESMDKDAMKLPAQPWEFRSKPAWQRLIIMIGGVTVNVLVAFIIYAMILFVWGEDPIPMNTVKNGVWITDSLMYEAGLRNGDKIVSISDKPVEYFDDVNKKILTAKEMIVTRNGVEKKIVFQTDLVGKLVESKRRRRLVEMRVSPLVGAFDKKDTSYASRSGLKKGDRIIAVDSVAVSYFDEMIPLVAKKKNGTVQFTVNRNGDTMNIVSKVNADGKTGLGLADIEDYAAAGDFKINHRSYSFFEAFPAGVKKTFSKLGDYIEQFKLILRPETGAYKGVGGFKSMGSVFPPVWNWENFWSITAFFSIVLAFMNLLPIPALDGGHVLFTLIEMITGRKPNEKFLEYAQIVGMVFLLGLMLYANGNDWFGWNK
ncbi:RIP metalloprotease RseP [Lacibacter luteus]|uniref:Zinc metalloprotease n=1 Tax=Lacibacter luteus TaxID=2508719 RepID=A0A4Q1CDQ2_9BACT|nr:RIP metalloprotease RseP [Lacibacter luteus]RXK57730.1 RIP metalloprotease RseP [Lacibacter luteus]